MSDIQIIQSTVARIKPLKDEWLEIAKKRLDNLTKPLGSLGRLEEIAQKICAIKEVEKPLLKNKSIFVLASDHGVAQEGVSAYPSEVTPQMVYNFLNGGAGINVLSHHAGARVIVVDMGVAQEIKTENPAFKNRKIGLGTRNFSKGPAMTHEEAVLSISTGIQLVEEEMKNGLDIVGTGEMGIGNTTSSSAITALITDKSAAQVTGQGTGIQTGMLEHKIKVIEQAIMINRPNPRDPIDVLSKIGGFEIGGMAGIILGAAANRVPVILDGFISGAAALIAAEICSVSRAYMIPGHRSAEPGHDALLKHLGLTPLLDLKMRLGEGTGAALAMSLVDAACKIMGEMATFESAGVSNKKEGAVV